MDINICHILLSTDSPARLAGMISFHSKQDVPLLQRQGSNDHHGTNASAMLSDAALPLHILHSNIPTPISTTSAATLDGFGCVFILRRRGYHRFSFTFHSHSLVCLLRRFHGLEFTEFGFEDADHSQQLPCRITRLRTNT